MGHRGLQILELVSLAIAKDENEAEKGGSHVVTPLQRPESLLERRKVALSSNEAGRDGVDLGKQHPFSSSV